MAPEWQMAHWRQGTHGAIYKMRWELSKINIGKVQPPLISQLRGAITYNTSDTRHPHVIAIPGSNRILKHTLIP